MRTVWMVSGNKGNVGKSAVAIALTQTLFNACGEHSVSVIDGDGRTPDVHRLSRNKLPSKALDFRRLRPDSASSMTEFSYYEVLIKRLQVSDHVVINTPDGADDQLMEWFDTTLNCVEKMSGDDEVEDVQFKFLYVLNHSDDGLDYLPKLASRFQKLYPVRNLFFGPSSRFKTFNEDFASLFNVVLDFPVLGGFEYERFKHFRLFPQDYVDSKWSSSEPEVVTPRLLSRQRVQNWLCSAHDTFSSAIYEDSSNLKQGISA